MSEVKNIPPTMTIEGLLACAKGKKRALPVVLWKDGKPGFLDADPDDSRILVIFPADEPELTKADWKAVRQFVRKWAEERDATWQEANYDPKGDY